MFSFEDKDNKKETIAKIIGGKNNNKIVYLNKYEPTSEIKEDENNFNQLQLTDGKFQVIPNIKKERDIVSYFGPSGVGKSYSINQFVINYKNCIQKIMFIYSVEKKMIHHLVKI